MGHADNDELRDSLIGELTEKQLAKRRAALIAGDAPTINEVSNAVLDLLSLESIHELVIASQCATSRAVIGQKFVDAVNAVMYDEAECDAIREVEQLEQEAKNNPDNYKPKTRAVAAFISAAPP